MPTGTIHIHTVILEAQIDRSLFDLRQHRDRVRRGMDSTARLGLRDALDAMDTAFVFEPAVCAMAAHLKDDLFEPAWAVLVRIHDLDIPAVALSIARIHSI